MKYSSLPPELEEKVRHTLFIDRSSSECGNCGKQAFLDHKTHDVIAGYAGGGEGCNIEWKYVSSNYIGLDDMYSAIKKLRPDLEFWLIWEDDKEKSYER